VSLHAKRSPAADWQARVGTLSRVGGALVPPSVVHVAEEIRRLLQAGQELFDMTIGDLSPRCFPTPPALVRAVAEAVIALESSYPPPDGMPELRWQIARLFRTRSGLTVGPEDVQVGAGARPFLFAGYVLLVDPGEHVVFSRPSFFNVEYTQLVGGVPVALETSPENGFFPSIDQLRAVLPGARLVVLASPGNPSGTIMPARDLEELARLVVSENQRRLAAATSNEEPRLLYLIFDQVYSGNVHGQVPAHNPAQLVPEVSPWLLTIDAASKAWSVTGYRCGWCVAPRELRPALSGLLTLMGAWAPRAEQIGLAHFLADDGLIMEATLKMHAGLSRRLRGLADGVARLRAQGLPIHCLEPEGGIYLALRIDLPRFDDEEIRRALLEQGGLAVLPFSAFGGAPAHRGWYRVSVGNLREEDVPRVIDRLRAVLEALLR